jgi:hypothetical protein
LEGRGVYTGLAQTANHGEGGDVPRQRSDVEASGPQPAPQQTPPVQHEPLMHAVPQHGSPQCPHGNAESIGGGPASHMIPPLHWPPPQIPPWQTLAGQHGVQSAPHAYPSGVCDAAHAVSATSAMASTDRTR